MGGLSDIIVTALVQVWTGGRDVVFVLVVLMGEYKSVVLSMQEEVGDRIDTYCIDETVAAITSNGADYTTDSTLNQTTSRLRR